MGLLRSTRLSRTEDDVLTISFAAGASAAKDMCQNNDRKQLIESTLSRYLGTDIKVRFKINDPQTGDEPSQRSKANTEKKNDIINDPAVKAVLLGLEATVTDVEHYEN